MLHQSHSSITGPTFFVVVTDDVFVIRIWMFGEVALNQISCFFGGKAEENVNSIDVATEQTNRMVCFGWRVLEGQKIVRHLWRTCHFTSTLQAWMNGKEKFKISFNSWH